MRLVLVILPFLPASAVAQGIMEWQAHGMATFANQQFFGGGFALGYRPPGRVGFSFSATAGGLDGRLAGRGEALVVVRLNPARRSGVAPYGTAGVAGLFSEEVRRGYMVAGVGLESRPGRRAGWFAEAGFGGGVRLVAGVRIRRIRLSERN